MNWLVTGGLGFVGSNLVHELATRGDTVVVIDDLSSQNALANQQLIAERHPGVRAELFSLADLAKVDRVLQEFQPDFVAHLAAQTKMSTSIDDPLGDCAANVVGTVNLLETLRRHAPQAHLFYASTNKVYGDMDEIEYTEQERRYTPADGTLEFDESLPLSFTSPYGCSKGAADQYVLDYFRIYGLKTTAFRHSSMFGVNQHPRIDHGWVTWFCQQAIGFHRQADYPSFSINGSGKQVRDVLHVTDVCRLYMTAADKSSACAGKFYNIGGGASRSLSLLELFELLESILNVKMKFHQLPVRISDQKFFVCNTAKVTRDLGWAPTVTAREGVQQSVDWLLATTAHGDRVQK